MQCKIVPEPQENGSVRREDGQNGSCEPEQAGGLEDRYGEQDLIRAVVPVGEPGQKAGEKKQGEDGNCAVQLCCAFA